MTYSIHKYLMAIILAGAMILALGVTMQTVYAEGEQGDVQNDTKYDLKYFFEIMPEDAQNGNLLPENTYHLQAKVFDETTQEETQLPDGATIEWGLGFWGEKVPDDFAVISVDPDDPLKATLKIGTLPDEKDDIAVGPSIIMKDADNVVIGTSMTCELHVQKSFYIVTMPNIDSMMAKGEEVTQNVGVVYHTNGAEPVPCDVQFKWDNVPTKSIEISEPVKNSDGSYAMTFKRLATDEEAEFSLTMTWGEDLDETQYFWLDDYTNDLSKCDIGIKKGKYRTIVEDNWCFIDEVAAKAAGATMGVTEDDIFIDNGDPEQKYDPALFDLEASKYVGYDENGEDLYEPASFPLVFDKPGSKDKNGYWTRGTSLYKFKVKAKEGSGWTGETYEMYLWVCSKYSLFLIQNNYGGGYVSLPKLGKYIQVTDYDPYWRYEVPKASKASKALSVTLGKNTLKMGRDYKATWTNDYNKSKKFVNKFPTVAGTYTLEIKGIDPYYGYDKSTHLKLALKNPMTVKTKKLKVKAKLKKKKLKKDKTYKVTKAIKVKNAKGKVTYTKVSGNKKILVASNGTITLKKGLKKGKYKVKVKVKASGNAAYFGTTKTVTFKVKVKKKKSK